MHCWNILKNEPKWESIVQGNSFRGLYAGGQDASLGPSFTVEEMDNASPGLSGKMPPGKDSSKSERKRHACATSEANEYLSGLHELIVEKLRHIKQKEEKREVQHEKDRTIKLKKLDLEAKKLSIRERDLKLEEKRLAQQELDNLLATRLEDVDEDVRHLLTYKRKHLMEYLFSLD